MSQFRYRKLAATILMSASLLGATGCSSVQSTSSAREPTVDLIAVSEGAAQHLLAGTPLQAGKPLLATSFADIDNLTQSSTLGRLLGEQFSSSMTQSGVPMIEVKMRDALFIREGTGELMLSRELRSLVQAHDAQAVVVGTYAVGGSNIYVTVRVVRTTDNIVLASEDFALPINRDIRAMLPRKR